MMALSKFTGRSALLALAVASTALAPSLQGQVKAIQIDLAGNAYLGIEMEDVTTENMATYKLSAERGVIVRSVDKDSAAQTAGLQEKDVILEFAGTPVTSAAQLARLVRETPGGRTVNLMISRDGRKVELTVKLARRDGAMSKGKVLEGFTRDKFVDPDWFDRQFMFRPGKGPLSFVLPEGGRVFSFSDRPRVGVTTMTLTAQLGQHLGVPGNRGVLVTHVQEGSPAAAAKIQAGDVIIKAGDQVVEDPDDLARAVHARNPGEKLDLRIIRDKKEITVAIELLQEEKRVGGYRL